MWQALIIWLAKTLGARLVTKELVLIVLAFVFEKLYEATKKTPVEIDDKMLLMLDNSINREELAQGIVNVFNAV